MTHGKRFDCLARMALFPVFVFLAALPAMSSAGDWRVSPIRLEFDRQAKSGALTVINESKEKLHVQMRAFDWTEDAEGKDQYAESAEVVFFPKMMVLEKGEERIVRTGIRVPAAGREKTYRLFIEEIPEPKKGEGTNVTIAIRFGVPIFVKPLKEESKGLLENVKLDQGTFRATVKNVGNEHFVIHSVAVKGKNRGGEEVFSMEIAGWYLLSGASRVYQTPVPAEICEKMARLEIGVKTDKFSLDQQLDVDTHMCLPQK
jgi:fimbrial chaperone protein